MVERTNGWKITAIIFIILFILETLSFAGLMYIGIHQVNLKTKCAMDICKLDLVDSPSTSYIYQDGMCYCYNNKDLTYSKQIG